MTELFGESESRRAAITDVVRSLVTLLTRYEHPRQAGELATKLQILTDPSALPRALTEVASQLHALVPGMGGLTDLYLHASTPAETETANERLHELTEQLYELTR